MFKRGMKPVYLNKNLQTKRILEKEEKIVSERVEKCKIKRRAVADKNKLLKKKEKSRAGQKKRTGNEIMKK